MFAPLPFFSTPKSVLREKMAAERRAAFRSRTDAPLHAARNFLAAIDIPEGCVVSLYHPIREELDTAPLAEALNERGVTLALPFVASKGGDLVFRRWRPGNELVKGVFGAMTPVSDSEALTPEILVTPLLAFTRAGHRLGYGGGYYDRTLATLRAAGRALAVGYAYGAQEVDRLPQTRRDQVLDWIITERGAIRAPAKG